MIKRELRSDEYHPYYQPIDKLGDEDVLELLRFHYKEVVTFIRSLNDNRLNYRYAEGKWTVKEIILHIIDTERVFSYRALCIARTDKTELPGFDQDAFVLNSRAAERNIESLLSEYESVRLATITLFDSFDHKAWTQIGTASNSSLSVRAIPFIIVGHEKHHLNIIKERYL
ncbi:DinB family protein [Gelidibacter mesophilus]|uniref:DinB family protein n=1 Tax=Gelidibacter mesophilus TaxID=169050 RepID=UPI000489F5E3|nr:DinB family protein [Gelidibacter mesophilus]